ncbi:MAG TPA: DUF3095 domain-containing protein [Casimicrobiaceae bacterium]|jgi:hypothetical protein|nr:DUF3095 domain-containing protein [Casimicrobiaceae bacterium]
MPYHADFYDCLPIFEGFANIMDPAHYRPLPDDWLVGLTDVVSSTKAIGAGRYKAVNTAGASVIAAVSNALEGRKFPFIFGGDGASFAVSRRDADVARSALAATAAWARDDLGLELRAALVPASAVREHALDLRVARFGPSKNVSFAMFSGGGLAWAEAAMKEGRFAVPAAAPGTRPDLSGLSCRWDDIPAAHGLILSLVVAPVTHGDPAFRALVQDLLADLEASSDVARPVPDEAPGVSWPPPGVDLEARASRQVGESFFFRRLKVLIGTLIAYVIMKLGVRVGDFDPARYRREVVENSDFRKFDDSLRMTLDCTPAVADRVERRLNAARTANTARFGLHRQPAAIMTCIVPSIFESGHVHFVDGAAGGYALAAQQLKLGARP